MCKFKDYIYEIEYKERVLKQCLLSRKGKKVKDFKVFKVLHWMMGRLKKSSGHREHE